MSFVTNPGSRPGVSTIARSAPAAALVSITAVLVACAPSIPRAPAVAVSASELASTDVPVGDSPSAIAVGEGTTETQVEGVLETDDGAARGAEVVSIVGEDGVDRTVEYVVDDLPVGLAYPVEGLVGQINGRPVFADEFLIPLESRILRIVAEMPRPQAVQQVDLLVARRFQEYLNSELIIAEAESRLSPEQQQGVLAWLTSMQEDMITSRGGTRDSATSSIEDEFGLSLEEFVSQRRSVALAQDLLRKRVQPRAIVSWRDVEQAYRRNYAAYNPPANAQIGRIRLHRQRQADQVVEATRLFGEGKAFSAVCEELQIPDGGAWLDIELPAEGIQATSLAAAVKSRLDPERPGSVTTPLEQGPFISWFTVLGVEQPPGLSIYEPSVQLALENELSSLRLGQEQNRYLASLKDRWVAGNIDQMRDRLILIARSRYLSLP